MPAVAYYVGSFDHLVGLREQHLWHGKAERIGRLQVDHELIFAGLSDGQLRRTDTSQDLARIDSSLAVYVDKAYAIAHQAAIENVAAGLVDRRDAAKRDISNDLVLTGIEERIRAHQQPLDPLRRQRREGQLQLGVGAGVHQLDPLADRAGRLATSGSKSRGTEELGFRRTPIIAGFGRS